jgi:hypothetical protein
MKMEQSVPKRWHIKFRRQGITQKKTYNKLFLVHRKVVELWMGMRVYGLDCTASQSDIMEQCLFGILMKPYGWVYSSPKWTVISADHVVQITESHMRYSAIQF